MNQYTKGTMPGNDTKEPTHWLWSLVGMVLGMVGLSVLIAWLIEGLA